MIARKVKYGAGDSPLRHRASFSEVLAEGLRPQLCIIHIMHRDIARDPRETCLARALYACRGLAVLTFLDAKRVVRVPRCTCSRKVHPQLQVAPAAFHSSATSTITHKMAATVLGKRQRGAIDPEGNCKSADPSFLIY
jgi:hypothetical protein